MPEARNGRDTLGFPVNNVNNGYLALHGDGYVEVADDASLDCTEAITMEAWIKPNEYITTDGTAGSATRDVNIIDNKGSWGDISTNGGHLLLINKNYVYSRHYANSTSVGSNATHNLVPNEWKHIVVTADTSETTDNQKFYIDGVLVQNRTINISTGLLPPIAPSNKTHIGNRANTTSAAQFNGSIDEPRIYNRALTASEVLSNYNGSKAKHRNN